MFNQYPYYRTNRFNSYRYNNYFIPTYYPNKDYNLDTSTKNTQESEIIEKENIEEENNNQKKEEETFNSSSNIHFRIGPFTFSDNSINIFGINIAMDDLIIIVLIVLLLFQSDTDYILIIILGLILLNINFSNFSILNFLK